MHATLNVPISKPAVSEADAQRAVRDYVASHIDPAFEVVSDAHYHRQPIQRETWRFFILCAHGPLRAIEVDAQSGQVIPFTSDEIGVMREKAAILAARQQGVLPVDAQGYVLGEYARLRANSYLSMDVSLFYSARDGIFVPLPGSTSGAVWQFSIEFRLPRLGALGILGAIDVDARTGEVIPLTLKQIKQIRECADALVELRTQTAAA